MLVVPPNGHALPDAQRKQIRNSLQEQLETLKVQEASKHMQTMGF